MMYIKCQIGSGYFTEERRVTIKTTIGPRVAYALKKDVLLTSRDEGLVKAVSVEKRGKEYVAGINDNSDRTIMTVNVLKEEVVKK